MNKVDNQTFLGLKKLELFINLLYRVDGEISVSKLMTDVDSILNWAFSDTPIDIKTKH